MKVGIYIFPNVEELDFVGVFEVLAKACSRALKWLLIVWKFHLR